MLESFLNCRTEKGKNQSLVGEVQRAVKSIVFYFQISFREESGLALGGTKTELEMVSGKALQSSRHRSQLGLEMTLSSFLAVEERWEGFKCPDSNNGCEGYPT